LCLDTLVGASALLVPGTIVFQVPVAAKSLSVTYENAYENYQIFWTNNALSLPQPINVTVSYGQIKGVTIGENMYYFDYYQNGSIDGTFGTFAYFAVTKSQQESVEQNSYRVYVGNIYYITLYDGQTISVKVLDAHEETAFSPPDYIVLAVSTQPLQSPTPTATQTLFSPSDWIIQENGQTWIVVDPTAKKVFDAQGNIFGEFRYLGDNLGAILDINDTYVGTLNIVTGKFTDANGLSDYNTRQGP
jgi:hypothetical protein